MKLSYAIEINSNPEKVFYWLGDPRRAMEWMTSVTRYEIINKTPDWIGTTFSEYIEENGQGTEMRGVVTDFVKNERIGMQLEGDYNSVVVIITLEEKGGSTRVTYEADVQFRGMLKVMSAAFGGSFKKKIMEQTREEFAKLKELCERETL